MDYKKKIEEIISKAYSIENGDTRMMLLEEAIREADTHQDLNMSYNLRLLLLKSSYFCGHSLKGIVAFSWCLAECDKDPQKFSIHGLLWEYKWILGSIVDFPQISRKKSQEMLEDMKQRLQKLGYSLRPYYYLQLLIAFRAGEPSLAQQFHEHILKQKRDRMADCKACELDSEVKYSLFLKKPEQALEQAKPLFQKKLSCAEVPQLTFATLLLTLYDLQRYEEAQKLEEENYKNIFRNKDFTGETGYHIIYLSLTNEAKALELFQNHLSWALEDFRSWHKFLFFLASSILLERFEKKGKETLLLRLPESFPLHQSEGKYSIAELKKWFQHETFLFAEKFNKRDQNNYHSTIIQTYQKYIEV